MKLLAVLSLVCLAAVGPSAFDTTSAPAHSSAPAIPARTAPVRTAPAQVGATHHI